MITVTILNDIQLRKDSHVFTKRVSVLNYDAKRPRAKKRHQLLYQQGERYGTVGDCCAYLTHAELEMLEASGYVRINRRRERRFG